MTTEKRVEVPIPQEMLGQALNVANDAVLVGGQALAFWIARYSIPLGEQPRAYISRDADFLGMRADVERFAAAVKGKAIYPGRREVTALAGVVEVAIGGDEFFGVDVVTQVIGLRADDVRKHAVRIDLGEPGARPFLVMDPVDCLVSRLENLRKLKDKQNEGGIWQASLSLQVCRKYMEQLLADNDERRAIKVATAIAKIARHAMGVQAFKRHGLRAIDCIPIDKFSDGEFKTEYWPRVCAALKKILESPKPKVEVNRNKGS